MTSHLLGTVFLPILIEPFYEMVTGHSFSDIEAQVDLLLKLMMNMAKTKVR